MELLCQAEIACPRVETGGKTVDQAEAGQRTAVNLAGIDHSDTGAE